MRKGEQSPGAGRRDITASPGEGVPSLHAEPVGPARTTRGHVRPITSVAGTSLSAETILSVGAERKKKSTTPVRQPWDGDPSENTEGDTREPLVKSILDCGDEERPPEEKVRVIARASDLMAKLGANAELVASMRKAEDATLSLGTQVLARKPKKEERKDLEGRGIYYKGVPVDEDDEEVTANVYVKGGGNGNNFEDENAPFSGLPGRTGKLFHDAAGTPSPRVNGAEYIFDGLLDLATSVNKFYAKAEEKGWTSIKQAIDGGVMVPLTVTHFTEASEYIKKRVEEERDAGDDRTRELLTWGSRTIDIGTVTQIVPSTERLTKGALLDEEHIEAFIRIMDPGNYAVVGGAMRDLLDNGELLEPPSWHAQNVFTGGLAAADPTDHMFIAHCKGVDIDMGGVTHRLPAEMQQVAVLFKGFNNGENLTPHHYPNPDAQVEMGRIAAMQENFWSRMLEGHAKPEAIALMARMMPFLKTEFNLTAALRLISRNRDNPKWAEAAARQDILLDEFAPYGVREKYQHMVDHAVVPIEVLAGVDVMVKDKLPINAMNRLLGTGDIKKAQEEDRVLAGKNDRLADVIALAGSLLEVPDERARDILIGDAGQYFGDRDILRLLREPDGIAAFEGMQAHMLTYYVQHERYAEAKLILNILNIANERGFREATRMDGSVETSELYYLRRLSDADPGTPEELVEIYNQCMFDKALYDFAHAANEGQDTVVFDTNGKPPSPEKVIRTMLGNYMFDNEMQDIAVWLHQYTEASVFLSQRGVSDMDRQVLIQFLDQKAAEVKDIFPELAYGHALIMAHRLKLVDPEIAAAYKEQSEVYQREVMQGRIEELGIGAILEDPSPQDIRVQYREFAQECVDSQSPYVGTLIDIYTMLGNGTMDRFGWPPEPKETQDPQQG